MIPIFRVFAISKFQIIFFSIDRLIALQVNICSNNSRASESRIRDKLQILMSCFINVTNFKSNGVSVLIIYKNLTLSGRGRKQNFIHVLEFMHLIRIESSLELNRGYELGNSLKIM